MKARTREGAELRATLLGENVEAPADPRSLPFDATDAAFAAGAFLAFVGAAAVWLPGALFAAGVVLMLGCWRLA